MKIIPNFLNNFTFKKMQDLAFSGRIPLYYNANVGTHKDITDFMFTHHFIGDYGKSDYAQQFITPLLDKLGKECFRAKLNCFTKKCEFIHTAFHTDADFPHTVALFSLNTCNGYTYFEHNKQKVKSIENQMIIFDGKLRHCSVSQTDTNLRLNININLRD